MGTYSQTADQCQLVLSLVTRGALRHFGIAKSASVSSGNSSSFVPFLDSFESRSLFLLRAPYQPSPGQQTYTWHELCAASITPCFNEGCGSLTHPKKFSRFNSLPRCCFSRVVARSRNSVRGHSTLHAARWHPRAACGALVLAPASSRQQVLYII